MYGEESMCKSNFSMLMERSFRAKGSNIVLALDITPENFNDLLSKSLEILEIVDPYICAVKVNRHLTLPLGLFDGVERIIKFAHELGLPAIMDCKINDVGHTNRVIAEYYFKAGFDAVIANPFVGWEDGLNPVFKVAREMNRGVILLVYMSHKASVEGYGQLIYDSATRTIKPQYMIFAERALSWGADGAVVGATYPERIREVRDVLDDKVPIYSPGVGVQGGSIEDAVRSGAKYLIVGRSILLADDPGKAAKTIRDIALRALGF